MTAPEEQYLIENGTHRQLRRSHASWIITKQNQLSSCKSCGEEQRTKNKRGVSISMILSLNVVKRQLFNRMLYGIPLTVNISISINYYSTHIHKHPDDFLMRCN